MLPSLAIGLHFAVEFTDEKAFEMKILLVDDDPIYVSLLAEILALYSHTVLKAPDGRAALDTLQRESVDLVISDASMPTMDGLELHTTVRGDDRLKDLPFIWNSAFGDILDVLRLENPELDFKFQKAMPLQHLLYLVNQKDVARRLREE